MFKLGKNESAEEGAPTPHGTANRLCVRQPSDIARIYQRGVRGYGPTLVFCLG